MFQFACRFLIPALLAAPALAGPVNINAADASTLAAELSGVGAATAEAIVTYRKLHGPFQVPDDLALVKGVGSRTVERNRAFIQVRDEPGRERD